MNYRIVTIPIEGIAEFNAEDPRGIDDLLVQELVNTNGFSKVGNLIFRTGSILLIEAKREEQ